MERLNKPETEASKPEIEIPDRFLSKDPHVVLEVSLKNSPEEIKRAWKNLQRQYHPDLNASNPNASEISKRVNKAYAEIEKLQSHPPSPEQPLSESTISSEKLQVVKERFAKSIAIIFQSPSASVIVNNIMELVRLIDKSSLERNQVIDVADIKNRARAHLTEIATNRFYSPAHFKQELNEWKRLGFDLSDTINDVRVSNYLYQTAMTKSREHYPLNFTNFVESWMRVGWKPSPKIIELLRQKKNNK